MIGKVPKVKEEKRIVSKEIIGKKNAGVKKP